MKTQQTEPPFSSVEISIPASWADLTQQQLNYIYKLCELGFSKDELKTCCFVRFSGLKFIEKIETDRSLYCLNGQYFLIDSMQLGIAASVLDFLDEHPAFPLRLERIGTSTAVDAQLHGVPFSDYLKIENLYQGLLQSKDERAIDEMAKILYPGIHFPLCSPAKYNILTWITTIKQYFSCVFSDLFRSSDEESEIDMRKIMDTQIRALTGGDVTKETAVLSTDCWRALTELNEKAREAKELDKINSK